MKERRYGWNGWKMPILHPNDSDYCEFDCPFCTKARKGNRLAKAIQAVEMALTFGGVRGRIISKFYKFRLSI